MTVRPNGRGQGLTEYILIVALVAVGTIGMVGFFGNDLRALFGMSADSLAGNADVTMRANTSDGTAETKHVVDFAQNNSGTAGTAGGDTGLP